MPKVDSSDRDRSCMEHIHLHCQQIEEALCEIGYSKE